MSKLREHLELEDVWVKPDLPVRTRAMNGFLLGMKRFLVSWGHVKTHFYADFDALLLRTGDEEIVKIIDFKLHWYADWSLWADFMNDPSVQELVKKFDELMSKSGGKGKGKSS